MRSVRIALLVSAGAEKADDGANTLDSTTIQASYQTFTLLDGAPYTPTPDETRIRRVFSTTITLNNALTDTRRKS